MSCQVLPSQFQRVTEHIDHPDFLLIIKIKTSTPKKMSIKKRSSLDLQLKTVCKMSVQDLS